MQSNASPSDGPLLPYVSALKDIPTDMPAFPRAYAISSIAYEAGFRWKKAEQAFKKIGAELAELKSAVVSRDKENAIEEIGDVLSAIVTLVVFTKMDAAVLSDIPAVPVERRESGLMTAIDESLSQVGAAISTGNEGHTRQAMHQLLADIVAFANSQGIDPEKALQRTNDKFTYRFDAVGAELHAEGLSMTDLDLPSLVKRWDKYKLTGREVIAR